MNCYASSFQVCLKCGQEQLNACKICKNVECGEMFPKRTKTNEYWEGIAKKGTINVTVQKQKLHYRVCVTVRNLVNVIS